MSGNIYIAPAATITANDGSECYEPGTSDSGELISHTCGGMMAPHFDKEGELPLNYLST